jgi:putative ABC transport system permease protein
MATALLAGAALMGRTLVQLASLDPGFEPAGVLSLTVSLAGTRHDDDPASRVAVVDAHEQALAQQPGVISVGAINHLPLAGDTWRLRLLVDGRPVPPRGEEPRAVWRVVKPGYFGAMGIGRVRGRLLGPADRDGAVPVALVNQTLARTHWPGGDPLGARIRIGTDADAPPLTVVGVVEDVRQEAWTGAVGEEVYVPYAQHARAFGADTLTWVVRTSADPAALAGPARRAVWSVDRGLPVSRLATLDTVIADHLWRARVTALLLGLFAGSALALAGLGVYGVSTYAMRRRTREIGIRIALGARPGHVSSLVAREMAAPVAGGVLAGCLLALALSRVIASLLYGVEPRDPATYVATALALAALATAAAWVPARRASRVDPLRSIREE